jgi:hypothetical protein
LEKPQIAGIEYLPKPQIAGIEHLRVLIANERKDRLALVAPIVANLGHEVMPARSTSRTSEL